jgi:hypothetical protein
MVRRIGSGPGSIRQTLPPAGSATQTAPAPIATPARLSAATSILSETAFVAGSILATLCSALPPSSTTQTSRPEAAMLVAWTPLICATTSLTPGSIRETVASGLTAHTASSPAATSCWAKPPPWR